LPVTVASSSADPSLKTLSLARQSVMFSARMRSASMAPRAPHLRATNIAAEIGSGLSSDPAYDVAAYLRRSHGRDRQQIYVVMRDGGVSANTGQPLASDIRHSALEMMGVQGPAPRGAQAATGPVITVPVQVDGQLRAMVVMPPPPMGGFSREVGRMLSLPGTLVLFVATVLAAWVIFRPARRRLTALEHAALALGSGDLAARAPDTGGDEIARVAQPSIAWPASWRRARTRFAPRTHSVARCWPTSHTSCARR
jgi:methyl-accepting chemotaxis protein